MQFLLGNLTDFEELSCEHEVLRRMSWFSNLLQGTSSSILTRTHIRNTLYGILNNFFLLHQEN